MPVSAHDWRNATQRNATQRNATGTWKRPCIAGSLCLGRKQHSGRRQERSWLDFHGGRCRPLNSYVATVATGLLQLDCCRRTVAGARLPVNRAGSGLASRGLAWMGDRLDPIAESSSGELFLHIGADQAVAGGIADAEQGKTLGNLFIIQEALI